KRRRSPSARTGSSSTATTRAPAARSAPLNAPVPAPMSSTRSPRWIRAARTSSAASLLLRRKCWPRPRGERGRTATEDSHCCHETLLRLPDEVVGLGHRLDCVLRVLDLGFRNRHGHRVVLPVAELRLDARRAKDLLDLLRLGHVA